MRKRSRIFLAVAIAVAGIALFIWWRSRLQVIGSLPPEEIAAIRSLLRRADRAALRESVRTRDSEMLADLIFERRDNRLFRLDVQRTNRVLAFYRTAFPSEGRILVLDRSTNGWWITETQLRSSPVKRTPNQPDAVNPAMAPLLQVSRQWRGVTDPHRSARVSMFLGVLSDLSVRIDCGASESLTQRARRTQRADGLRRRTVGAE